MKQFFNKVVFLIITFSLFTTFIFAQGPPPPPGDDGTVDDVLPINMYYWLMLLIVGAYFGISRNR